MLRPIKVVLTGGPCGGKTSALAALTERLQALGHQTYRVPEIPTLIVNGGAAYPGLDEEKQKQLIAFEHGIMNAQLAVENSFRIIADATAEAASATAGGRAPVLLFDRGALDLKGYMPQDIWERTLQVSQDIINAGGAAAEAGGGAEAGWEALEELLQLRYDGVVHIDSAALAENADDIYSHETNAARTETAEQARELDAAVRTAWGGHSRWVRVQNPTKDDLGGEAFDPKAAFELKIQRTVEAVLGIVGTAAA